MTAAQNAATALNEQQRKAVEHPRSALVLAGAGTGKTKVIAERVARLLAAGAPPEAILALTFTNKAAGEMRARIGAAGRRMIVGTFHSFARRLLLQHSDAAGLPANFQIVDATDQTAIIKRILQRDMNLPRPDAGGPEPARVRALIEWCKENALRHPDVDDSIGDQNSREAYRRYELLLREQGKADFAELLLRCYELLRDDAAVRRQWQQRFAHILVDELQDINGLQLKIIGLLKDSERTVMFGVGDDDQSIYGFRGARPQHLREFAEQHAHNNVLRLERNYRSTERILELANAVIRGNDGRLGKTLFGAGEPGALPVLEFFADDIAEARAVAQQVALLRAGAVPAEQIAVFYRNNSLSLLLEDAFNRAGVPFRIRGGMRFFARKEVKDLVAYLQAAAQPDNLEALLRSVNRPPRKVGPKAQQQLEQAGGDAWPMIEASSHPGLRAYSAIISGIRAAAQQKGVAAAAEAAVTGSGLQPHLAAQGLQEQADNLDEVVSAAARFARHENGSLDDFLAQITLEQETTDDERGRVSLMTIHTAKGLEFDHVFVIGLEDGILPSWNCDSAEELRGERRLLYVAITRARRALHLSFVHRRRQRGRMQFQEPSRMFRGVPEQLWERRGAAGAAPGAGYRPARQQKRRFTPQPASRLRSAGGFQVGQKVASQRFGKGVVLALEGEGDKAKARVLFFSDRKARWLMLQLAKLRPG